MKAAAPVGSTSAWAEVTASGAGRLCAEQNFARSAALGCIKVPSRASKSEIPDKARDTKLDRDVALKILPEAFVNDPERLARFQREARVLAGSNHSNQRSLLTRNARDRLRTETPGAGAVGTVGGKRLVGSVRAS